jgi:hypothetical protein
MGTEKDDAGKDKLPYIKNIMQKVQYEMIVQEKHQHRENLKDFPKQALRLNRISRKKHWKGDMFVNFSQLKTPSATKYTPIFTGVEKRPMEFIFQNLSASVSPRMQNKE